MSRTSNTSFAPIAIKVILPVMLLLSGCAATTITDSSNPSRDRIRAWRDYKSLPVIVLGDTPDHSKEQLAAIYPQSPDPASDAGRHIVLYINPAALPARKDLCSDMAGFRMGGQTSESAEVTGAICDGGSVVTIAAGRVLSDTKSSRWTRKDFDIIRDQLYQSLVPGANDPSKDTN